MPRNTFAILLFSTAMFLAALFPFFSFRPLFTQNITGQWTPIGFLTAFLWHLLPVFAAIWAGLLANYSIRRSGRLGFWRGVLIGIIVIFCCSTLWGFVMASLTPDNFITGVLAGILFGLLYFGWVAALAGGITGFLSQRAVLNGP